MRRKLSLCVVVLASLLAFLLWSAQSSSPVKQAPQQTASVDMQPPAESLLPYETVPTGALAEAGARKPLPQLFHYQESAPYEAGGERPITWDFSATQELRPGDSFAVILPSSGEPSEAVVMDESSVAGNRRLEGKLLTNDGMRDWPFSITLSEDGRYVAANFATATDNYSMEASERGGRIFSARNDAYLMEQDGQLHDE